MRTLARNGLMTAMRESVTILTLSLRLQFFDKEYNTSAQLRFLEGRDPNIRKGANQYKTNW